MLIIDRRLVGKVTIVVDKRRVDQSRVRLAEVEVGDETGTVSLRARDEQIDVLGEVSKRSGAVVLRNCTLELYQGKHIRLAVTKWGKLCVYPDSVASTPPPPSQMNFDRNFSLIDLSVVASEMVDPQPETSYSNRPTKSSEPSATGVRPAGANAGGQTHSKYQQPQSSPRRGNRDRRQPRGKHGGSGAGPQSHYGGAPGDAGTMQSPPGQMRYHGMQPFPAYDQGMDPRQYSYPRSRQQEQVIAPASAQIMLQRQYELQQRQLQQMYGQQDRHRPGMGQSHQVQTQGIAMPGLPLGSFDTSGEYQIPSYSTGGSDQHPSIMSVAGSNPILIPMTMPGIRGPATVSPVAAAHPDQFGPPRGAVEGTHGDMPEGVSASQAETQYMSVSSDESQYSSGKMNPDATAFAPSCYMGPQGLSRCKS